jgi:glycosyltransferase involved in cell wall biosynthesis
METPTNRARHTGGSVIEAEMAKWDLFYAGLEELTETPALEAFHVEFTAAVAELMPPESAILEAGCGAAFQSLALAREGRYQVSIMDFSTQALASARRRFDEAGLGVDAQLGNVFVAGEPRFDLVFNAGVLEHYTLDQQADFLRGMASRSRRYVLTLTPNRHCYWYWIWRIRGGKTGDWPFGKECPQGDLATAFRRAGLRYLGQTHLGAAWTEDLLGYVRGMDDDARKDLLAVHRSGVLDPAHTCYLTASLGAVEDAAAPTRWASPAAPEDFRLAELTSGLADSLALRLNAEGRFRDYESSIYQLKERCLEYDKELVEIRREGAQARVAAAEAQRRLREIVGGRTYHLAEVLQRLRQRIAPSGSWRAHTVRALVGSGRGLLRLTGIARARKTAPTSSSAPDVLAEVHRRAAAGQRPIVFLPSIPWNATLFQRPQHLARQFARLGHPVVYDCSGTGEDLKGLHEIEPNLFLYKGDAEPLHALPDPLLWAFSYNFHLKDGYGYGADAVYDWIDDLSVFPYDPAFLRRNHARGLREAVLVASVARRLHRLAEAVRPDALYLPNAAEYERFADEAVPPSDDADLSRFLQRPGSVAGYYGALASWFDYTLLEETARRRPDWNFVLIGPNYDGSIDKQSLLRQPNVAWLGPRAYEALPGCLKRMDVTLIPFIVNDITLATSPLKLYEYFSAGKPVITTPMPECQAHSEVRIVRTAQELDAALDAALADGQSEEVVRHLRAVGRANSWQARAKTVLDRLDARGNRQAA